MIRSLAGWAIVSLAAASVSFAQEAKKDIPGAAPAEFKPYTEAVPRWFVKIDMVPIKGGKTVVTLPSGPKEVDLADFWMARCEIRWDDYDAFRRSDDHTKAQKDHDDQYNKPAGRGHLRSRPSHPVDNPDRAYGHEGYAANSIALRSARDYCKWLYEKTGRTYRLPTEAEFEYVLQAGKPGKPAPEELLSIAWLKENSPPDDGGLTGAVPHPVGKLPPNALGICDLYGNLTEWCTPLEGDVPVVRGGSFKTSAKVLHPGYRQPYNRMWQDRDSQDPKSVWWLSDGDFIGFRVVRDREERK